MNCLALRVYVGSGGIGVERTVFAPKLIKHEFRIVFELDAHPVPADLRASQLVRKEFMIHPTGSADGKGFSVERDCAAGVQARERKVMRSMSSAGGFLADAIFAVDNR